MCLQAGADRASSWCGGRLTHPGTFPWLDALVCVSRQLRAASWYLGATSLIECWFLCARPSRSLCLASSSFHRFWSRWRAWFACEQLSSQWRRLLGQLRDQFETLLILVAVHLGLKISACQSNLGSFLTRRAMPLLEAPAVCSFEHQYLGSPAFVKLAGHL